MPIKILKELQRFLIFHSVVNVAVLIAWLFDIALDVKNYGHVYKLLGPYEIGLIAFNAFCLIYVVMFSRNRCKHILIANRANDIMVDVIMTYCMLAIYYAMKYAVEETISSMATYIDATSALHHTIVNVAVVSSVFPLFFCGYLAIFLYGELRIYRIIGNNIENIKAGDESEECMNLELEAEDANRY